MTENKTSYFISDIHCHSKVRSIPRATNQPNYDFWMIMWNWKLVYWCNQLCLYRN